MRCGHTLGGILQIVGPIFHYGFTTVFGVATGTKVGGNTQAASHMLMWAAVRVQSMLKMGMQDFTQAPDPAARKTR